MANQLNEFKGNFTINNVNYQDMPLDYSDWNYVSRYYETSGLELASEHTGIVGSANAQYLEQGQDIEQGTGTKLVPAGQVHAEWRTQEGASAVDAIEWMRQAQRTEAGEENILYKRGGVSLRGLYQPRGYAPGNSYHVAYLSGSGSFDTALFGTAERIKLVITHAATSTTTFSIELDGTAKNVNVNNGDSIATIVSTRIPSTTFSGWVVSNDGTNTVYFTALSYGNKTGSYSFNGGTSGVTATGPTVVYDGATGSLGHRVYFFNALVVGGGGVGGTGNPTNGGGGGGGGGAFIGGLSFPADIGSTNKFFDVTYSVGAGSANSRLNWACGAESGVMTTTRGINGSAPGGGAGGTVGITWQNVGKTAVVLWSQTWTGGAGGAGGADAANGSAGLGVTVATIKSNMVGTESFPSDSVTQLNVQRTTPGSGGSYTGTSDDYYGGGGGGGGTAVANTIASTRLAAGSGNSGVGNAYSGSGGGGGSNGGGGAGGSGVIVIYY